MKKILFSLLLAAALAAPASAAKTYEVQFLANGGTGTMAKQTFAVGAKKKLAANAFKRTGYVFAGWSKTATGAVAYQNKQAVSNLAKAGKTKKLYAVWAKKKYKVAFVANGGTGAMAKQAFVYGKAQKLRANAFKRSGFTFAGWAKTKKGAVKYKNKQSVKNLTLKGGTVKLYAVWTGKKATYKFAANGGTGTMDNQTLQVGKAAKLRKNAFKRSGFTFLGWAKKAAGPVVYANAQSVKTPASTGGKTVTLYAVWGGDQVLVSGGKNAGTDPDFGKYSLDVPTFRMDRTEVPWALWKKVYDWGVANGYAFENAGSAKAPDHPVCGMNWYDCLKWCNARSEMEGLAPAYKTGGKTYKTGRYVPADPGDGPGYRLPTGGEWEYAARGGLAGKRFPWGDAISHDNANYFGQSTVFDTSEGFHPVWSAGAYPYTAPVGRFPANGFGLRDMAGNAAEWVWQIVEFDNNGTVQRGRGVRGGAFGNSDCRCGFASWKNPTEAGDYVGFRTVRRPPYDVKFSANGGTGSMATLSKRTPGADVVLAANAFSRENKDFLGWSTNAAATAAVWKDGATVKGGFVPRTGTTVVLYAIWGPQTYKVRFHANGGSGAMADQTLTRGVSRALSANAFARADFTFAGWATNSSGAAVYADKQAVRDLAAAGATAHLYATWKKEAFYVAFDRNGGTGDMDKQRLLFDAAGQTLSPNLFAKADFLFAGWATSRDGPVAYADGAAVDAALKALAGDGGRTATLYAKWEKNAFYVAFDRNGGEGTMAKQRVHFAWSETLSPNQYSKTDCRFDGWALSASGAAVYADGAAVDAALKERAGDGGRTVTLYATWKKDAYYVSFDPNGGSGSMAKQRMQFGVPAALASNAFVKVGWVFGGWALSASGDPVYADGAVVTNDLTTGDSATLYATWWGGMVRVEGATAVEDKDLDSYSPCDPFYVDATETTIENWTAVRTWAATNGYPDLSAGAGKGATHPVHSVSWHDCVKWCNARSEMEGLDPAYTLSDGSVYREGETVPNVDPTKNGYRLPSKDEWGHAASGGVSHKRFPWGTDSIDFSLADYAGRADASDTWDASSGHHPDWDDGTEPFTAPVGTFDPTPDRDTGNLYDLAGNVAEWNGAPPNGEGKCAVRGGGWNSYGRDCSWGAVRYLAPTAVSNEIGFRTVRTDVH